MFDSKCLHWPGKWLVPSGLSLLALLSLLVVSYETGISKPAAAAHTASDGRIPGGSLIISGGGYVSPQVRQRFLELAGGPDATIVVIPALDPVPGTEDSWLTPWRKIGATHVEFCNAHDRTTANTAAFCAALNRASGVWFSGGYQDFLAERYVGTAVQNCLNDVLHRNGVIGGVSAGAAILSKVMIQEGENQPIEARGLDLVPDTVIDQHFLQRNRLWRLQQVLEAHPGLVGLGIDENTALVFEARKQRLSVLGESYAFVCIPTSADHPARTEILHAGDNVLLSDLRKNHLAYQPPRNSHTRPIAVADAHGA